MCTYFAGKHQKTWHGMLLTTCKCEYRDQGYDVRYAQRSERDENRRRQSSGISICG
jgi:hypothetical protein